MKKHSCLSQVAKVQTGHPFRGRIDEVRDTRVLAVQMKDVSASEGVQWLNCIETAATGKHQPDWLSPDDILFAAKGSHNYSVLVGELPPNRKAVASPHFFVIRLERAGVLPEFLAWQLNQAPCQRYFEQNSEGTFTKSIRRSVLESTPLAFPDMEKQHTIVALAETIRREQQVLARIKNNGDSVMNAIAKELFETI